MARIDESFMMPMQSNNRTNNQNNGILGKDDFLKILLTQLQNQDPSNPMDDREFIAQMAQFSTLEQMTNMNTTIQKFVNLQMSQSLVQHSELIGKEVTWMRIIDIDEHRQEIDYVKNTVTSVRLDLNGELKIQLDGDRWISQEQLYEVSQKANVEDDSTEEVENEETDPEAELDPDPETEEGESTDE